jgi:hypothetical protein
MKQMTKYLPVAHTKPAVATVDGGDVFGQGSGALIAELIGDGHSVAPTALLKPTALDPDGFPSSRASNQRVLFPSTVGQVG